MPKNIGKTLKEYRIASGISVKEISDLLTSKGYKASEKTIYSWESGNSSPSPDALLAMCSAYNIDNVLSAFGYDGYNEDGSICLNMDEISMVEKYRDLDDHGRELVDLVLDKENERYMASIKEKPAALRMYTYMHKIAAAGNGFYFDDIPTETIEAPYMPGADFIIGVSGDSMEPTYSDGDLVYVEKRQILNVGEIGIFTIRNECYIKKVGEDGLLSHNPKYKTIPGTEDIHCIGKVLGKVDITA